MDPTASLDFYKIQGAGNDFVVIEGAQLNCAESERSAFIKKMSHRQLGLGCDQVLEILSFSPLAIQIWNQDGSKAEMCGNGARAFALLADQMRWLPETADQKPIPRFEMGISGVVYSLERTKEGFALNLGKVKFHGRHRINVSGEAIPICQVEAPNPHTVVFLGNAHPALTHSWNQPENFDFKVWGPQIESNPHFPKRTNVEFVYRIQDKGQGAEGKVYLVDAKVWERGSGATLSSGSGSVATARAVLEELLPDPSQPARVEIKMNQFTIIVRRSADGSYHVGGPAQIVAKGQYFIS